MIYTSSVISFIGVVSPLGVSFSSIFKVTSQASQSPFWAKLKIRCFKSIDGFVKIGRFQFVLFINNLVFEIAAESNDWDERVEQDKDVPGICHMFLMNVGLVGK